MLVIRSFEPASDAALQQIHHLTIETSEVIVKHATAGTITVDDIPREITVFNDGIRDHFVGQYRVPPGEVVEARIVVKRVTVVQKDGTIVDASDDPSIPSWKQSGWKLKPVDDLPWPMVDDELNGVRVQFHFDEEVRFHKVHDYKFQPTVPAEAFFINPREGEPGIFFDRLVVVFKAGTSIATIDAINAEIGARILRAPQISQAYRIKFPPGVSIGEAWQHYVDKTEVQGVLPMIQHDVSVIADSSQDAHTFANLAPAWDFVEASIGAVGSSRVQIAIIDTGANLKHPEILLNIAINQGELPPALFDTDGDGVTDDADVAAADTDGDGLITLRDLNHPMFSIPRPNDFNMNGIVDGEDLLHDSAWANNVDEDNLDANPDTFKDDLVGWDFIDNDNDPSPVQTHTVRAHGTKISQVAGGIGDNGIGIAGTAWRISLVPLRGLSVDEFMDASFYAEQRAIPIINYSAGRTVATDDADLRGANRDKIDVVSIDDIDHKLGRGVLAYQTLPWIDDLGQPASRALDTFGAGNVTADIGRRDILFSEAEFLETVIPNQVLIVGNAATGTTNEASSSYGSNVEIWAPGRWTWIVFDAFDPANLVPETESGTSASAPCVAGIAALILSRFPSTSPAELHDRLLETASPSIDVTVDGVVKETQRPLVNACRALATTVFEEQRCIGLGP